jgi:adenine-specific DNA-methyltransferase
LERAPGRLLALGETDAMKKVAKVGPRAGNGKTGKSGKTVETLRHGEEKRKNIPTAEYQSVVEQEAKSPVRVAYERRNRDLDPQLVWRGKDQQDWSDLVVQAPPLYIQEKVHPKALVDDLMRQSRERREASSEQPDLFADFNGIPEGVDKTEFYRHDQNWSNRMILGDSLQVMASLAEREGLRGKVQCIYLDPPYGIKFNSNFQWSTTSRDVKDGNTAHITREPEQVKAFRDTWRDGIHSYLTYLRDRLTVARDLLTESGSIFVQIGDENVHRVRAVMDEVFGEANFISEIVTQKTGGFSSGNIPNTNDYLLWYSREPNAVKFRPLFEQEVRSATEGLYQWITDRLDFSRGLTAEEKRGGAAIPGGTALFQPTSLTSQGASSGPASFSFRGKVYTIPQNQHWKTTPTGLTTLGRSGRLHEATNSLRYVRLADDFPVRARTNTWTDTATGNFTDEKVYVVQTASKVIERCILMATDPGDLVLDPTCGSGTTAYVAEQWGRRWITIDTSRVALALARARIMGARYSYYLLADSPEGLMKEAEQTEKVPASRPTSGSIRQGFVYERVPHITLKSIANNAEIDVIWEKWQEKLEPLREKLNAAIRQKWEEWEIPREPDAKWPESAKALHADWWKARVARQKEIDASIAAKADFEHLYDKPYQDAKTVRVAGPFTVESLSPHRVLGVDENDALIDQIGETKAEFDVRKSFPEMILENLRTAGVQQAHKDSRIVFSALTPWPGDLVCGDGRYREGEGARSVEKRAAIFIGPEFGTVTRPDLVEAAKEAGDGGFDVLITCAFNYDAHATEFSKLGRIPVLKARMNADLHMAEDLKNTGKGNLFVIFGEPDIDLLPAPGGQLRLKVNGVDVFHPQTGEVRSDGPEGIACWFVDTDYNEESFFVRHAYFLGANDPYGSLKTTLKAEVDEEAWATLHSDTSRPFPKPTSGRIAVKVINHLGDEVMKVFRVA